MDFIKKLVGVVAGLFCTLVVAWFCSFSLKMDLNWYNALCKPTFMVNGEVMSLFVSVVYALHVLLVARLVKGRHFFPSMVLLFLVGLFSILFVYAFFTLKQVYLAFVFIGVVMGLSLIILVRFFSKDWVTALYYLPVFIFNLYCTVVASFVAFFN